MDEHKCEERVKGEGQWGGFNRHPCSKKAKYFEDEKWYCKTHAPSQAKLRREKREARRAERENSREYIEGKIAEAKRNRIYYSELEREWKEKLEENK